MNREKYLKSFLLMILCIAAFAIDGYTQKTKSSKISGVFRNMEMDSVALWNLSKLKHEKPKLEKFAVGQDGSFSFNIDISERMLLQISDKKFSTACIFLICPGDTLNIEIPETKPSFDKIKFSGSQRSILLNELRNQILLSDTKCFSDYFNVNGSKLNSQLYWDLRLKSSKKLNLVQYINLCDIIFLKETQIIEDYKKRGLIDTYTYQSFLNNIKIRHLEILYSYCIIRYMFNNMENSGKQKIDSALESLHNARHKIDEMLFSSNDKQAIVTKHIDFTYNYMKSYDTNINGRENELDVKFKLIQDSLQGIQRDFAFYEIANKLNLYYERNQAGFFNTADSILVYFNQNKSNDYYFSEFEEKLDEIRKHKIGETYMDFVLLDSLGNEIHLSDFKDKYVLLHIWGTWCGGCIAAIPKINKLYKELDKEKIEFIHIAEENFSKEGAFEKWKTLIQDKEMRGINVHTYNSDYNFDVLRYPSYILLGKDNKIKRYHFFLDNAYIEWLKELLAEE